MKKRLCCQRCNIKISLYLRDYDGITITSSDMVQIENIGFFQNR